MESQDRREQLYRRHIRDGNYAAATHELRFLQRRGAYLNESDPSARLAELAKPIDHLIRHGNLDDAQHRVDQLLSSAPSYRPQDQRLWQWQLPVAEVIDAFCDKVESLEDNDSIGEDTFEPLGELQRHLPLAGSSQATAPRELEDVVDSLDAAGHGILSLQHSVNPLSEREDLLTSVRTASCLARRWLPRGERLASTLEGLFQQAQATAVCRSLTHYTAQGEFERARKLANAASCWDPSPECVATYSERLSQENVTSFRRHVEEASGALAEGDAEVAQSVAAAALELFPENQRASTIYKQAVELNERGGEDRETASIPGEQRQPSDPGDAHHVETGNDGATTLPPENITEANSDDNHGRIVGLLLFSAMVSLLAIGSVVAITMGVRSWQDRLAMTQDATEPPSAPDATLAATRASTASADTATPQGSSPTAPPPATPTDVATPSPTTTQVVRDRRTGTVLADPTGRRDRTEVVLAHLPANRMVTLTITESQGCEGDLGFIMHWSSQDPERHAVPSRWIDDCTQTAELNTAEGGDVRIEIDATGLATGADYTLVAEGFTFQ